MNPYLLAMTKLAYEIKPQQQRVLDKLDAQNGVVVMHGMGSGKTLTSLIAAEREQKRDPNATVQVVVPAPLVSNMYDQAKEHGVDLDYKRFNVVSYEKATNNINALKATKPSLLIMDEGQRIRNKGTARSENIRSLADASKKVMILSGTPDYNGPQDMAVLVNTVAKKDVLPDDKKGFEDRYIENVEVKPGFFAHHVLGVPSGSVQKFKNKRELHKVLSKYVDTYDARESSPEHFPSARESVVKVDMDHQQEQMYKFVEGKVPFYIRWKINRGLPLNKTESRDLNAFSTGVRQVSNSTAAYSPTSTSVSPKLKKMADHIEHMKKNDPNFRSVAYSNYLESGLKPLSQELNRRGIRHALYDGSLSQKEKDGIVHDYNHGKLDTVLVSSSGQEGLNLKGTKLVQIMEPHFNRSKIDQVIARGIRYNSHAHLPENERHVEVVHYQSVVPHHLMSGPHKSIDEYLYDSSSRKKHLQDDLRDMMKSASIPEMLLMGGAAHVAQNTALAAKMLYNSNKHLALIHRLKKVRVPGAGKLGDFSKSEVLGHLESAGLRLKLAVPEGDPNTWGGNFYRGLHNQPPTWGRQLSQKLKWGGVMPELPAVADHMRWLGGEVRAHMLAHDIDPSSLTPSEKKMFAYAVSGSKDALRSHLATLSHATPEEKARQVKILSSLLQTRMGSHINAANADHVAYAANKMLMDHSRSKSPFELLHDSISVDLGKWRDPHDLPSQNTISTEMVPYTGGSPAQRHGAPAFVRKVLRRLQESPRRDAPGIRHTREFLERRIEDDSVPHGYMASILSSVGTGGYLAEPGIAALGVGKALLTAPEYAHVKPVQYLSRRLSTEPMQRSFRSGEQYKRRSRLADLTMFFGANPVLTSANITAHRAGRMRSDLDAALATAPGRAKDIKELGPLMLPNHG